MVNNIIKIKSIRNIEDLIKIYKQFKKLDINQKVIFDFSDANFVNSNYCAFLNSLIDGCKIIGIKPPKNEKVLKILRKNDFITKFTGLTKLHDEYKTVIECQTFDLDDILKQNKFSKELLDNQLLKKKGLTNISNKLLKEVSKNILELFNNSREHSKSTQGIYIAGQFFPKKHKLDFTLVDTGIGIVENVNNFFNKKLDSGKALHWAIQEKHTTRLNEAGGLGLGLLKELIIKSNGSLEIISNDGLYFIKNQKESFKTLQTSFCGTIVNIEFNIEQDKVYKLKNETK